MWDARKDVWSDVNFCVLLDGTLIFRNSDGDTQLVWNLPVISLPLFATWSSLKFNCIKSKLGKAEFRSHSRTTIQKCLVARDDAATVFAKKRGLEYFTRTIRLSTACSAQFIFFASLR